MTALSAGCLSLLSGDTGSPAYTSWLYTPGSSEEDYSVGVFKVQSLQQHRSHLDDSFDQMFSSSTGAFGTLSVNNVETLLILGSNFVYTGNFDTSSVSESLQGDGYTEQGTYEGYTLFEHSGGIVVGVSGSAVITGFQMDASASEQVVKGIIDTKSGSEESYAEQNETVGTLTEHLGTGDLVSAGSATSGPLSGTVGGEAVTVEGETSQLTIVAVFGDEGSVDKTEVEPYLSSTSYGKTASDVSYSQDGRVMTAEATIQTKKIRL
jgi:hypothetical protein